MYFRANMEIKSLYKLGIFTLEDVMKTMAVSKWAASRAMQRWQHKGLIRLIRRNLYTTIDLATDKPSTDRFEVASRISATSYVGWHTAMEYHGLGHQMFFHVYVGSESRFKCFTYDGINFDYYAAPLPAIADAGVIVSESNPNVKLTDLERTLIDCCDRVDRAGGAEELMHCIASVVLLDEEKLSRYLAMYNKAYLYQKVGFILECIKSQASITDRMIEHCNKHGALHVKYLTKAGDSNRYVSKWKLYVPDSILTQNSNVDDII